MERQKVLNCPVDSLTMDEALGWMSQCIVEHKICRITVINANKLWMISKDLRLKNFVYNSDLIIPEWAVYWGARQLNTPLKSPIRGVSLLLSSLPWAERNGYRIFFFGAKPHVVDRMMEKLRVDYPKLIVAGAHHGYIRNQSEEDELIKLIKDSQPDILYLALGSPKQEYWLEDHQMELKLPVVMGVGGSFDVLSGIKTDTPDWARSNGLEWLYRLSQDPKSYWRRYLITNSWFITQIIKEKLVRKNKKQ